MARRAALPARLAFAAAAQPTDGAPKAASCVACHGDGRQLGRTRRVPSLAGQPAQFISTQLFMFREGNRKDPLMIADGGEADATPK